jgi:hypothetical protein
MSSSLTNWYPPNYSSNNWTRQKSLNTRSESDAGTHPTYKFPAGLESSMKYMDRGASGSIVR